MRITPWISQCEFRDVFEWIYSIDLSKRRMALERIQSWKSRSKIPLAVQATFDFVEIQMQDQFKMESDNALRLLYSMAMIRFVNGILDQAQGMAAKSMTGVAENIGLPVWFVEIRHSATHDQLPSLELLRSATDQALDWIYRNYWACQYSFSKLECQEFFNTLKTIKNFKDSKINSVISRISDGRDLMVFIDFLLEYEPETLSIWDDAFKLFEKEWKGFTILFFKRLIESFQDSRLRSFEKWALWLLQKNLVIRKNPRLVLELLANSQISDFTVLLLKKLIVSSPELQRIFGSVLSFSDDINLDYCNFSQSVFSGELEELDQRIKEIHAFSRDLKIISDSGEARWSKAVESSWNVPIGCLPDGSIPNLDFDLIDERNCYLVPTGMHPDSDFSLNKVVLL